MTETSSINEMTFPVTIEMTVVLVMVVQIGCTIEISSLGRTEEVVTLGLDRAGIATTAAHVVQATVAVVVVVVATTIETADIEKGGRRLPIAEGGVMTEVVVRLHMIIEAPPLLRTVLLATVPLLLPMAADRHQ
jgi:hypothetical protein